MNYRFIIPEEIIILNKKKKEELYEKQYQLL